jgi:hypothetical protein
MNVLNVILPFPKERLEYLPHTRLGPAVGHGARKLGLTLLECILITPEVGGDDRTYIKQYGEDTRWIRFSFEVPNKVLANYEVQKKRTPQLEPFDKLIANYVSDVADRLSAALVMKGRVRL